MTSLCASASTHCACILSRRPRRNEQRFEERLPHAYRKAWRSESVTYYGAAPSYAQLPQQQWGLLGGGGALFAAAALLGAWAAVGAALRRNFHRTRCGTLWPPGPTSVAWGLCYPLHGLVKGVRRQAYPPGVRLGLETWVLIVTVQRSGHWKAAGGLCLRRYDGSKMWLVLLLWPLLALLSDSFRRELRGALSGRGAPPPSKVGRVLWGCCTDCEPARTCLGMPCMQGRFHSRPAWHA